MIQRVAPYFTPPEGGLNQSVAPYFTPPEGGLIQRVAPYFTPPEEGLNQSVAPYFTPPEGRLNQSVAPYFTPPEGELNQSVAPYFTPPEGGLNQSMAPYFTPPSGGVRIAERFWWGWESRRGWPAQFFGTVDFSPRDGRMPIVLRNTANLRASAGPHPLTIITPQPGGRVAPAANHQPPIFLSTCQNE